MWEKGEGGGESERGGEGEEWSQGEGEVKKWEWALEYLRTLILLNLKQTPQLNLGSGGVVGGVGKKFPSLWIS